MLVSGRVRVPVVVYGGTGKKNIPIVSMGLVYLLTFTTKINHSWLGKFIQSSQWIRHGIGKRHQLIPGSTISTLLHDRINPKDCQVLSLGHTGFLQFFRVVSRDYGKP